MRLARRLGSRLAALAAAASWAFFFVLGLYAIFRGYDLTNPATVWQYDWNVYALGGQDLVDRTLYRVPLQGAKVPVDWYNLPPLSALFAVPLLWLPLAVAGNVWLTIGLAANAVGIYFSLVALGVRRPFVWGGVGAAAYSFAWAQEFGQHVVLGNINSLVFALLAVGLAYRHTWGGWLLGAAMAAKAWPLVLAVPMWRTGDHRGIRQSVLVVAASTLLMLAWLGFDMPIAATEAFSRADPAPGTTLWLSHIGVPWPVRAAMSLAALALPLHGRAGYGTAILAGVWLVPNLWDHYAPTAALGLGLVTADAYARLQQRSMSGWWIATRSACGRSRQ